MKVLSILMASLLIFGTAAFADRAAQGAEPQRGPGTETPLAVKIKAEVHKRGTGEKSKVKVTLGNGTMVKGYISKAEETSFDVNGNKVGQATTISYTDVQKVQGPGLSTGAKIAIGVSIGVAVVAIVLAIGLRNAAGPKGAIL